MLDEKIRSYDHNEILNNDIESYGSKSLIHETGQTGNQMISKLNIFIFSCFFPPGYVKNCPCVTWDSNETLSGSFIHTDVFNTSKKSSKLHKLRE